MPIIERPKELDIQLELKDRLNYPFILTQNLLSLEKAYSNPDFDLDIIENLVIGLYTKIPDTWRDNQFEDDLEKSASVVKVDLRPQWGEIILSKQMCIKQGIPFEAERVIINYFKLLNAIINLLDRRGILIRKDKIEYSTGKNLDENIDELIKDEDIDIGGEIEENTNP